MREGEIRDLHAQNNIRTGKIERERVCVRASERERERERAHARERRDLHAHSRIRGIRHQEARVAVEGVL